MEHRHLLGGYAASVEAVEDVLDRGSVEDWRALAQAVLGDPGGAAAQALRTVLGHVEMYGTTGLWRGFLLRVDSGAIRRPAPSPAVRRPSGRRPAPR